MESKFFKLTSIIVLFFFTWTSGGLFDIAYAIKNAKYNSASGKQSRVESTEEKFEKAIGEINNILADNSDDTTKKKRKLRQKRTEIDGLVKDIRKQFTATEKKLKKSKMPDEILQRHYSFVKRYEDNLKELRTHLDTIEKASAKVKARGAKAFGAAGKPELLESDFAIEETKTFFGKIKPPKRHRPLDPNKLPHRAAEPVFKEPRTKPEEFKKDERAWNTQGKQKPILVASSGPLGPGLLSQGSFQIAQASNLPTADDLAETIEVQLTPEIKAKALELENNPVRIYNWVRNNIEFVSTYGSIQGANMCLQTKQCNAFDTSSLLIALLRASGINSRYVYGTIELPIDKVNNWLGGFTDTMAALTLLASGGIPSKGIVIGGEVKSVQMEHVWVEAWIDYVPSRGAKHKTGEGDTWIRLDPSFKQYNYTQGIDIKTAVPFDAQSFADQLKNTATINETEGYVTNVDSLFIQQKMQDYQSQVKDYISQNYPNATVGDLLGKKEIVRQEFTYLLGTLPYKTIASGAAYSSIPDNLRHKITFNIHKDVLDEELGSPMSITKSLPELAGAKITLSYSPATPGDEAIINSYLPKPHADGTPIQPNELPSSLPAYLINLKPELRINGVIVATGTTVMMGSNETFTMTFNAPNQSDDVIANDITAGEYLAVALDTGKVSQEQIQSLKAKLESTKAKLEGQNFDGLTKDDILGDLLYTTALSYHAELALKNYFSAKTMGVSVITLPSETIFSSKLNVDTLWGTPISISPGGLAMDADRLMKTVEALDGNMDKRKEFMLSSGSNLSALEHSVPEQLFSTQENPAQGISAVKALQIANDQGIPIYKINKSNIDSILPQLQLNADTILDIQNAVNAGREVTVSKTNINFNGWIGCGYIITDPQIGEGAYLISGGYNGAWLYIRAFFEGWLSGLVDSEYPKSDSMFGDLIKISEGRWIRNFLKVVSIIMILYESYEIISNPNLNLQQKIGDIIIVLLFGAIGSAITFTMGGLIGVLLAIGFSIASTILQDLFTWGLNKLISIRYYFKNIFAAKDSNIHKKYFAAIF